ncbi:MAG: HNH endonuclease [Bacteroidota bacterium]
MERWNEIDGHPGYWVSDLGQVKHGEKILSLRNVTRSGKYKAVRAHGVEMYVHRLVAGAFIGSIAASYQVNHLDGNPENNELSNLEIVTPWENVQHARKPLWYTTQLKLFTE